MQIPSVSPQHPLNHIQVITCLFLALLSGFLFIALSSFSVVDPGWTYVASDTQNVANLAGVLGAWVSNVLRAFLGWASFFIPLFLVCEIYHVMYRTADKWKRYFAQFFFILASSVIFNLSINHQPLTHSGGIFGYEISQEFSPYLTIYGVFFIAFILALFMIPLCFSMNYQTVLTRLSQLPAWFKDVFYIAKSDEALLKEYHFNEYYQQYKDKPFNETESLSTSTKTDHTPTPEVEDTYSHLHDEKPHTSNTVNITADQVVFGDVWQNHDKNHEHLQEIQQLLAQSQQQLSSLHDLEQQTLQRHMQQADLTQQSSYLERLKQDEIVQQMQKKHSEEQSRSQKDMEAIDLRISELNQQIADLKAQEQQFLETLTVTEHDDTVHARTANENEPELSVHYASTQTVDTQFETSTMLNQHQQMVSNDSHHLVRERLNQLNPLSDLQAMLEQSQTTPVVEKPRQDEHHFVDLQAVITSDEVDNHLFTATHEVKPVDVLTTQTASLNPVSPAYTVSTQTLSHDIATSVPSLNQDALSHDVGLSQFQRVSQVSDFQQDNNPNIADMSVEDHLFTPDEVSDFTASTATNSTTWDDDAPLTDASGRIISRAMQVAEYRKTLSPLPSLDLLDPVDYSQKVRFTDDELDHLAQLLELKLQDFNIKANVEEIDPGPVVTRFALSLAPGVKATKVASISQDLARSMSLKSVRIVLSIPGTPFIGVEVPNKKREMVRLIELIDNDEFRNQEGLSMAMGKNITGKPIITNLAKAPHMLVAGTTGSGKSVAVNAMLLSLLLKYTPEQLRLVLIDPKMLELANYDEIPHLLTPVITDMNKATNALNWCVNEMERRYELMALFKLRQITSFNERIRQAQANGEDLIDPLWKPNDSVTQQRAPRLEPLPSIVVIADEFADMMMQQSGKKTEMLITRLAQKARAAGIHLLLATQRPSVDVITGLIKANIPTRVALRVGSKIDSRTILDAGGAEELLGNGDMLFLGPGQNEPERVHGAFISDDEVNRICDAWRERGSPNYIDDILVGDDDEDDSSSRSYDDGTEMQQDVLYDKAVEFVLRTRKASGSSLQREFGIGYQRGAKLIDMMERNGIVSPANSSNKREILV